MKTKIFSLLVDLLLLVGAYFVAYYLRNTLAAPIQPLEDYMVFLPFIIFVFGGSAFSAQLYRLPSNSFNVSYRLLKSLLAVVASLMIFSYLQKFDFSRGYLLIFALLSFSCLWLAHMLAIEISRTLKKNLDDLEEDIDFLAMNDEHKIAYEFIKTIGDYIVALIGLIVFLPLWLLIAALIKIDSPGPALFTHERVGLNGKIFKIYKFRTMFMSTAPQAPAPTGPDDSRITKIGRLLRKTSIDEAPQFINILQGKMSLIGPRPEMPFIVEEYDESQRQRLKIKPGITGLWQVLGRKDIPLKDNLHYDFYYLQHRSFLLDFVILVKTIYIVISGKGAY